MKKPVDFRELIKAKMAAEGITAHALARRIRPAISRSMLYYYLRGEKHISDDKLAVILAELGIRVK